MNNDKWTSSRAGGVRLLSNNKSLYDILFLLILGEKAPASYEV
ncbi:hypothetical protein [Salicibibacter kimchii]|nr:hypothetical protein [Salicibibacter kimchii]